MSVNVAVGRLADESFLSDVGTALHASGLRPDRLILEITRGRGRPGLDNVIERLRGVQDLGARIAIDDFGTGYSSLSYLTRLPLDILKVDKPFIDGVTEQGQAASVTAAIIAMSRTMNPDRATPVRPGLDTVAEGVEHADQATWLLKAGCSHAHGHLWSPPVELEQALHMVRKEPPDTRAITAIDFAQKSIG